MIERKRRNSIYLVDRDFQLRYTWAAVWIGVVSTTLTAVVILYPLYTFQILRTPRFLPWPFLVAMALAALMNVAFVALMGVIVTHRIAGPMYSVIRHLRRMESGKWAGHARTREADELKYVVRNVNGLVDSLVASATRDLALVEQILAAEAQAGAHREVREAAEELRARYLRRLEISVADTNEPVAMGKGLS